MELNFVTIVMIFTGLATAACSTCVPGPSMYVRGEMVTEVDSSGAFISTKAARTGLRRITLRDERDSGKVQPFVPFILDVPDVLDLGAKSIKVDRVDQGEAGRSGPNEMIITLVDACSPNVELLSSCQIVNWYNPYRMPQVVVKNGLVDQVIATPIVSNGEFIVGYEIRLGDQKYSKCDSPAFAAWRSLYVDGNERMTQRVVKKTVPLSTKNTPSSISSVQRSSPPTQRQR